MQTDIKLIKADLYFLPVKLRVPLKFGNQVLTQVTCARVRVEVSGRDGKCAQGWGETPLSVGWVWPSNIDFHAREQALFVFCRKIAQNFAEFDQAGHPMEIGSAFIKDCLSTLLMAHNKGVANEMNLPYLAALVCFSPFDIALHDAYGNLHDLPVYETYNAEYMNHDLSTYLEPAIEGLSFKGKYPEDFLVPVQQKIPVWHLVGGLDPIEESELTGNEPNDGYPVLLEDWIDRDGLKCLKVKLRGNDSKWDYDRLVRIGDISVSNDVEHLTVDFNCTVSDPEYVNTILDNLKEAMPDVYKRILYVEQPFPYDLKANQIDVHSTSSRKLLFMDESAHDWRLIRLGFSLGWTGVALKTCKTQTGALLSLCWAKAHDMAVMVQDLTNPMLAQISHVLLAGHAGTIMGVESNGMQFYPEASLAESKVHPGVYRRREGLLDLSTIQGPGFGYRLNEIERVLPEREQI
jgi:L-alanine-DL-glutamate epimerase-like enolase superfamily enzyme